MFIAHTVPAGTAWYNPKVAGTSLAPRESVPNPPIPEIRWEYLTFQNPNLMLMSRQDFFTNLITLFRLVPSKFSAKTTTNNYCIIFDLIANVPGRFNRNDPDM